MGRCPIKVRTVFSNDIGIDDFECIVSLGIDPPGRSFFHQDEHMATKLFLRSLTRRLEVNTTTLTGKLKVLSIFLDTISGENDS